MSDLATCGSCKEPIRYVLYRKPGGETGRMPVDPRPAADGNIAASQDVHGQLHVLARNEDPRPGERLYRPHWASCPHAAQHRTRRPAKPPPVPDEDHQTSLF